jgi:hypothetical protein
LEAVVVVVDVNQLSAGVARLGLTRALPLPLLRSPIFEEIPKKRYRSECAVERC